MAQPSQLETRVVSILDSRARRRTLSRLAMAGLCMLTGLITISSAAIGVTAAVPLPPVLIAAIKLAAPAPEAKVAPAAPQRTRIGNAGAAPNITVTPPQVIESAAPSYTNDALVARIEGTVTLEASVDAQGNASVLRVVKGLGFGLDETATDAVKGWKFAPALRNGLPVQAITQIDVDFKLPAVTPVRGSAAVKPPTVISRIEPQYTDEARAAHLKGTVVLEAIIHKDGTVGIVRIVHALGFGLDNNAIEALQQWVFKPGTKNGEPVDVALNIEVNFNLK
jgi:TonB family protein